MKILSKNSTGLNGCIFVPGDKSISHRALMFGALAEGTTHIKGLLEGEDVLRTAEAMRKLGAEIIKESDGTWAVTGRGKLHESSDVLDMGNAGTGARLLMGVVSSHPIKTSFTGDASLCSRPMNRVIMPLSESGAGFESTDGGKLPLTVIGAENPKPIIYTLPVASAQVKSAVLLAGLNIEGSTIVYEPILSRDHTERMLKAFGADIIVEPWETGHKITLNGKAKLKACDVDVPADISSAAFPIVAALITKNSEITLKNIGLNPLRAGLIDVLLSMGANISFQNPRQIAGEPAADLIVRTSNLHGITVSAEKAPSMIDEYPILAVAAAFAKGQTRLCGLGELKVKESNRFKAIIEGLSKNGVSITEDGEDIIITPDGKKPCGGGLIQANLDHRIAMSFMIMGMASEKPIAIDDISSVATSFPDFVNLMNAKGAHLDDYSN